MSSGYFKASDEVFALMEAILAEHHDRLVLVSDEIAVVFREKAGKKGGKGVLGTPKKAPPLIGVLGDTDYKFVLEIAGDEWLTLTEDQRKALIDHLLCACQVEEDPDSGNVRCFIAPPDVSFYWAELDRHGDWRPRPVDADANAGDKTDIEQLFGRKSSEPAEA